MLPLPGSLFFLVWRKNAPYEIGYPLFYSTLVILTVIRCLCLLIPSRETLLVQVSIKKEVQLVAIVDEIYEKSKLTDHMSEQI